METLTKKCDCGKDCMLSGLPKQWIFKIPFTQIEILIWDWSKQDYLDHCQNCLMEDQNDIDETLDIVHGEGFREGYRDAMIENGAHI